MDIRLVILIIFSFIFEIFFLSKDLRFKENPISIKDVEVEFINSKTYDISSDRISNLLVTQKIEQSKNKKIFYNPVATMYDNNITKTIISKKATLFDKTNIIKLENSVKIVYLDKQLSTDMIEYDLTNKTVTDSDKFTLKSNSFIANGNHLYFDTKHNIIKSKDIKYIFYERE